MVSEISTKLNCAKMLIGKFEECKFGKNKVFEVLFRNFAVHNSNTKYKKMTKKIITKNKKAYHDYFVEDTFEAGIELLGTEVKSIRSGKVNLRDSFCHVKDGELIAQGIHISPYEQGNIFNKDPKRPRRLLMHKREINRLYGLVAQKGYALIPLSMYFIGKWVKVELGLCKGKKLYDKRETAAERTVQREAERYISQRNKE